MIIALACDHGGLELKEEIKKHLEQIDIQVIDEGTYSLDSCNYAEFAIKAAKDVASKQADLGILVCTSGEGVAIAANKVKGAYAALLTDVYSAERAIKSNNSNIACLGAFTLGQKLAMELLKKWLSCEFDPNCASQEKVACYQEYDMNRS